MLSPRSSSLPSSEQPSLGEVISNHSANSFNLVRLLAAGAVIFGHSFVLSRDGTALIDPTQSATEHYLSGTVAVAVFFLVSGIFVSQSLDRDRSLANFLIRRGLRIWPGLIVCLFASAALAVVFNNGSWAEVFANRDALYRYIINGSLLKFEWTIPGAFGDRTISTVNGSIWSLLLEVRMYVVLALLSVLGVAFRRELVTSISLFMALAIFVSPDAFAVIFPFVRHAVVPCLYFLVGMVVYAYRDDIRVSLTHVSVPFVILFVVHGFAKEVALHIFIIAAILWIGSSQYLTKFQLKSDYSYGIYLYGFPAQQMVATLWPAANPYFLTLLALPIAAVCAVFSWHQVEQPALVAARRLIALWHDKAWLDAAPVVLRGVATPALIVLAANLGAVAAAR